MDRQGKRAGAKAFAGSSSQSSFGVFSTSSTRLTYLSEPPNLSSISNPNVVVSFKNLLKKDSTTKTKALEELLAYVQSLNPDDGGVEDAILEAWVQVYPRLSIDNSRRARELSHTFQLELMKSGRKRMEKRIPLVVGTWLAGLYDKDRAVSKAATDGLTSFLNTDEKMTALWRKCQVQIMEYATESVAETPDTLSDERSTTKEDAEAKYYRVMGGSLSLVLNLLAKADLDKLQEDLDKFLANDSIWSMAAADDSFVRKAVYQLLQSCIETRPEMIRPQLPRLSRILLSDSLKSNQTGSATELVGVLSNLTRSFPEVWGTKKSPLDRLRVFVEKGSQGSSWAYWQALDQFLSLLPVGEVPEDVAGNFLKAMRVGISSREEPRANAVFAWACYINAFGRLLDIIEPSLKFVQENFYPLTRQYLYPTPEGSSWASGGQPKLFRKAWNLVANHGDSALCQSAQDEWKAMADAFVSRMANSLPEVSKDFEKSQKLIADEGDRWFTVVEAILSSPGNAKKNEPTRMPMTDLVVPPSNIILLGAIDLLSRRNYKPFGAASVINSSLATTPRLFDKANSKVVQSLFPLDNAAKLAVLLQAPACPYLLSCVNALSTIPQQSVAYEKIWNGLIYRSLQEESNPISIITKLISTPSATPLARGDEALQQFLFDACLNCATGASDAWGLLEAAVSFDSLTPARVETLIRNILDRLEGDGRVPALRALESVMQKNASVMSEQEDLHVKAVAKLLALSEIADSSVSSKATALRGVLDQHAGSEQRPLVEIVQANLDAAGPLSLSIDTLVEQAKTASSAGSPIDSLVPSSNVWMTELHHFLRVPDRSLALTSSLGGAYFLIKDTGYSRPNIQRDRVGRSIPVRMAMYMSQLFSSDLDLSELPLQFRVELLFLLCITIELAGDQMTLGEPTGLWDTRHEGAVEADVANFISSGRRAINTIASAANGWRDGSLAEDSVVERLIQVMLEQTPEFTPIALYSAKALSGLLQSLSEAHGIPSNIEERFVKLDISKATPGTVLPAIAFITGFGEALATSATITKLCNKLVSDIAGAFPSLESSLRVMVLLNACISVYESGAVPVEIRRQIFAIKQMTSWTDTPDEMSPGLAAETCKGLHRIFPHVSQIYGPYWEQSIEFCITLWEKARRGDRLAARLPYLHSSLKLMTMMETLHPKNDDLKEALATHSRAVSEGLIGLLKLPHSETQPAKIVDALLCRRATNIPLEHLTDLSSLYGLVASESRDIQTAAFSLLHRAVPAAQSKLSVDALLDKQEARLPDELLSLLLDAPTLEKYPDDLLVRFPTPVRCYLLAWHLIFDTFGASVPKVRDDYLEHLKREGSVGPLLEFMFDVLGHSAAHPLNLDREGLSADQIRSYDITVADGEPEEHNMHWLLVHLYYLVLKYAPGLFKAWYLDLRSKQTKVAVASWMQKYFSPLVISEALDEVVDWNTAQEPPAGDEKELHVKVSKIAKEVTAGYEVDEELAQIAIRVPPAYPLDPVSVVGVNRVGVNEKRWQGWLLSTQGVVTFTNGSLVDGLNVFRRNVVGALKGQTECAICYSIVSSDKRMPDKKCGTCKNLFHRTCLYRWFQTSSQNTCPLCRNPIDYLGSDTKARRV